MLDFQKKSSLGSWFLKQEKAFWALIIFGTAYQAFMQIHYFSNKGDIYTQNLDAISIWNDAKTSIWIFLRSMIFQRIDKGTVMPIFEVPFVAFGMNTYLMNRIVPVLFAPFFFGVYYKLFRLRIGPWGSVLGSLALISCELVFKNISEFEKFIIFMSFFPAIFLFWEKSKNETKTFTINSCLMILSMFFCIGVRPFESFFFASGVFLFFPRIVLSKKIMTGFILGGFWWIIDPNLILSWWNTIQRNLSYISDEVWGSSRILNPVFWVVIVLVLSTGWGNFKKALKDSDRSGPMLFAGGILMVIALVYKGMIVDDYFMLAYLPMMFILLRYLLNTEKKTKLKWRTLILTLVVGIFHVDQGIAIVNGMGPLHWGRNTGRLDLHFEEPWQKMRPYFSDNKKNKVGFVFYFYRPVAEDVRPIWCALQSLALRDRSNVEFYFPSDYNPTEPISYSDICKQGFTHLIVVDPAEEDIQRKSIYVLDNQPLPEGFLEKGTPVLSFSVGPDAGAEFLKMNLRMLKTDCPQGSKGGGHE